MVFNAVTPFAGVWIETRNADLRNANLKSHPSRVCGLKPLSTFTGMAIIVSHPSRVCGLKPLTTESVWLYSVTPFAGVWIETPRQT